MLRWRELCQHELKKDDQRHRLHVLYIIPVSGFVSCCPLSSSSLLLSFCATVPDVEVVLTAKISIIIGISNSYHQIIAGIFSRSPCQSFHCHIWVAIKLNKHIGYWLTWNKEKIFKAFPRAVGVHGLKE